MELNYEQLTDEKLREGYWYVLQNPYGFLSELDNIHPDLADNFASVGIIAYGMNSHAGLRYQLTDDGRELAEISYDTITANLIRKYLDHPELMPAA
ncbi:MAG: hypothetical protein J6P83_00870 [Bacteroidales bacterium]|nr:hypothetical protein [Bacteroidales bacterium]